jgi:hypothetical protein
MDNPEDVIQIYNTSHFLTRDINGAEMDAMRALMATEGWQVLQRMMNEKKEQQVEIGMRLRTDPVIREQARAMHHGIQYFACLSENLDEAFHAGVIEPAIEE